MTSLQVLKNVLKEVEEIQTKLEQIELEVDPHLDDGENYIPEALEAIAVAGWHIRHKIGDMEED